MQSSRNKYLLCNWIFVLGLISLFVNDHYLKPTFHNWLTGKISDFSGLLIFPMFLQFLFPRLQGFSSLISALIFIFWKSPLSEFFIESLNSLISIRRVVDYSDLAALSMLPISHYIIHRTETFKLRPLRISIHPAWLLLPSCFVFMATSYYRHTPPNGDIYIGKTYHLKMSKAAIMDTLFAHGYVVIKDTARGRHENAYVIENVPVGSDTISAVKFDLYEYGDKKSSRLDIETISIRGSYPLNDWKALKRYTKYYQQLIQSNIIKEVKRTKGRTTPLP